MIINLNQNVGDGIVEMVLENQNVLMDSIKIRENLIQYGRFLESRSLKDNDNNYEEYLKLRIENSKLDIGCFLLHLQEAEENLVVIDLEKDEHILFDNFNWKYNDNANGGIHIWNGDRELNIEVNDKTVVRDDIDSIVVDDKWSLEVW